MYDLIIKNGTVILENESQITDVAITDGKIVKIENNILPHTNTEIIDASGLIVSPGMIDAHVHIVEPSHHMRDDWEGYMTATKACAKGGVTSVIEMPLNQLPATIDKQSLEQKIIAGKEKLFVDVFSFGGLVPHNIEQGLEELNEAGVVAYKCFLATCGDADIEDDFMKVDDYSLYEGMKKIAATGKVLAIHAENAAITDTLTQKYFEDGANSFAAYTDSRPVVAEVEAIQRIIFFAKESGCRVHICHISSREGVQAVIDAQNDGVDITCETCLHYLYFSNENLDMIGSLAKCAPPIRDAYQKEALWNNIHNGAISFVTSDHSPCPPALKETGNIFTDWGGIAGIQNNVDILFDEAVQKRKMSLEHFGQIIATQPAKRYGLKNKGGIALGKDADFVIIQPNSRYTLKETDLEYRHKISPYIGCSINAQIMQTILRGKTIYQKKTGIITPNIGKFF